MPTLAGAVQHGHSLLDEQDIYLFREGTHERLCDKLGAHPFRTPDGLEGTLFAVWAPNAESVCVMGDFNGWNSHSHSLAGRWDRSGIWEGFVPGVGPGDIYKYWIASDRFPGGGVAKGDPFAQSWECPPRTASVVADARRAWGDEDWMRRRGRRQSREAAISTYEVHLGSWKRPTEAALPSYRSLGRELADYALDMGFTHIELLPVAEHPFYGSWGYQCTGFFAPTRRYGTPEDFMALVDCLHQAGIGVILDWVPSHFPSDEHGLARFDGTCLYEHEDPRQGYHPDWNSYIFNYGRPEVRSFLISSAHFWLDRFHIDGLRVDAVASMLYLDYSRDEGEWIPNARGGNENDDAVHFLRQLNRSIHRADPSVLTIAEESTSWPGVSHSPESGGLGFDLKWKMGWMHDTLSYFAADPLERKHRHDRLTFSMWYAYSEDYLLPLSHDEVVHGKGSLASKMPGDRWRKLANLRSLLGYMFSHPGKKLLFMGGEFGQWSEWDHDSQLDWGLLSESDHSGVQAWVRDLNHLYRCRPALHRGDFDPQGFRWIDFSDREQSVISYLRRDPKTSDCLLAVCNFTPVPRPGYRLGVPRPGGWKELLNSDSGEYGGSGVRNGNLETSPVASHGFNQSIELTLPPLAVLYFEPSDGPADDGLCGPQD